MKLKDIKSIHIIQFRDYLVNKLNLSPRSINRKMSSLKRFLNWAINTGNLKAENIKELDLVLKKETAYALSRTVDIVPETVEVDAKNNQEITSEINQNVSKNIISEFIRFVASFIKNMPRRNTQVNLYLPKEDFAPHSVSRSNWPLLKKLLFHLKYTRPSWYQKYHSIPIVHYVHFAILIILISFVGFGLYNQLFAKVPTPFAIPKATTNVVPKRYLSFQGRLTDSSDNPISSNTNMRFGIYNSLTASQSAKLWEEQRTVDPDEDGIFNLLLGEVTAIPASLFSENPDLWLGITVGRDAEAKPRQRIATVGYAVNAEYLQGHPPSASVSANQIPVMTESGDLYIAQSNPRIYSASGGFKIQGQTLTLTTSNSGDLTLRPDWGGRVLIRSDNLQQNTVDIVNSSVEIGTLIYGYIGNNYTTSNLLKLTSGSTETQKFLVDFSGNASASGDLVIGAIDTSPNISTANMRSLTIGNSRTGAVLLAPGGTTALTAYSDDITIADTLSVNGATIGLNNDADSDNIFGLSAASGGAGSNLYWGNALVCNASDSNCGWAAASGASNWQRNSGTLSPKNITDDLLIGQIATPSSTTSDYFQVFGTGSTAGDASSSGILTLGTNRTSGIIETEKMLPLVLGSATTGSVQLAPKGTTGLFVNGDGNVGINNTAPLWKLHVSDSQTATASAMIENTATNNTAGHTGLIVRMGTTGTTVNANDRFINFMSGENVVGKIQGTAASGVISYTTEGVDFGEYFTKADSDNYEEGDVMSLTSGGAKTVGKSKIPYDGKLLGIVSARSGFTGGKEGVDKVQVGLIGQIPVKIASSSEPIIEGDLLTSSTEPGRAMKAVKAGPVVGKAMEGWTRDSGKETIWAFINVSWHDPTVKINQDGVLVDRASGKAIYNEINVNSRLVSPIVETNNIIAQNASIDNLTVQNTLTSPVVETDQLIAKNIESQDATVSGTLYAGKIVSDELVTEKLTIVERIEEIIKKTIVEDQTQELYATTTPTASDSASLSYDELMTLINESKQEDSTSIDSQSFAGDLYVFGKTNLADAFVTGTITQGLTFQITEGNSINVLNGTLYLQSLGGAVDLANGSFTIDSMGNSRFTGNVVIGGTLAVNTIITEEESTSSADLASGFGKLLIKGSVNITGQLIADSLKLSSDYSATDSGLIIAASLTATSSGIYAPGIKTNGTTGVGVIPSGETEVVIFNNNVSNSKLIYLTPTSETGNKVLYVRSKADGFFTVAIDTPFANDISFNWWIIN